MTALQHRFLKAATHEQIVPILLDAWQEMRQIGPAAPFERLARLFRDSLMEFCWPKIRKFARSAGDQIAVEGVLREVVNDFISEQRRRESVGRASCL